MGDKISALPSATSVDGTELVPIVQGGTTKKVTGLILRNPAGSAGGDLTGTFPNPTLAAVTTAQTAVGSGSAIPVLTTDAKGRVVALTTVANPALTTNQIAGLSTTAGAALATAGVAGLSSFAARADHQHARPTPGEIGALGATAAAGGDLTGNFPNPTLSAITTAQTNVGSGTQVPVLSVDAKGRVTSLSSVPISSTAGGTVTSITAGAGLDGGTITTSGTISLASVTTAQSNVGSSTVVPVLSVNDKGQVTSLTTAEISTFATTAGGDLTGAYPNPTLAAITAAQSNVGSGSAVPVLSVDAKGRVTALSTIAISALTTAQIAGLSTTAPAALATTPVVGLSTFAARADHQHQFPTAAQVGALASTAAAGGDLTGNYPNPTLSAITTAQSNVGSALAIPVISTDAKGRVTGLSTVAFAGLTTNQIAGLSTAAPAALSTTAIAGTSTFAARADHRHVFPTAAEVGALGATAAAGGDLTGNYPSPTLAAITTAQSNIGSSSVVPVLSVDAKGRVTSLTTAAIAATSTSAITALTGDVTASGPGFATATLAAITTAQANVGSSTQVPVLSIDAKGRVTALSSVAIFAPVEADLLVVAGGGGATGGGGGAGGVIQTTLNLVPGTSYTITVGAGGAGTNYPTPGTIGANGGSSIITGQTISTFTAIGGGGAGKWGPGGTGNPGQSGGSGGGAGANTTLGGSPSVGGAGTTGQGFAGGSTPNVSGSPAGGGGGAGAVGANGVNPGTAAGGNGGVGISSSITGTAVFYAGGGGGASNSTQGTGGSGGGGNAALTTGGAGTVNTGGGGGGASGSPATGGNGGSGVVILSIPTAQYTGTTTGSPTVTVVGSRTVLQYNSSGTYTA